LSEIIGHVDPRDRPLISLSLPGQDDEFLVTVDTGFNGELLIHDAATFPLAFERTGVDVYVEFADGGRRTLELASGSIVWFGRQRAVDIWIAKVDSKRSSRADEPAGLIGTGLISPHSLTIDFAARRVVIAENDD
jgi:predicted aspartyl protease